jgi:hypothetical protein
MIPRNDTYTWIGIGPFLALDLCLDLLHWASRETRHSGVVAGVSRS